MKTKKIISPTNNAITSAINQHKFAAVLEIDIENQNDVRNLSTEIQKFVANDLSKHSILVLKHR